MPSNGAPQGTVAYKAGIVDRTSHDKIVMVQSVSSWSSWMTTWEAQFIRSLSYQVRFKLLSAKQTDILDDLLNRVEHHAPSSWIQSQLTSSQEES